MLRPPRPLTVCLLWLAIALLPLRAWAASAMPVDRPGEARAVMAEVAHSAAHGDTATPCHQGNDDAEPAGSHSCGLCGVCHSAVVSLPDLTLALSAPPSARPPLDPFPGVERPVLGGPERPPRSLLA